MVQECCNIVARVLPKCYEVFPRLSQDCCNIVASVLQECYLGPLEVKVEPVGGNRAHRVFSKNRGVLRPVCVVGPVPTRDGTEVLQWCVAVVLHWCHIGVAVVLQWCCSGVTVVVQ